MKRILIATDFSDHAARAAEHGAALARLFEAELELFSSVFISPLPMGPYNVAIPTDTLQVARDQARTKLEETAAALRETKLTVQTMIVHEDAASGIEARAEEIDAELIVMGTRGRTGLAHVLFGSVAERVARLAPCPVLTAHADSPAPSRYKTILVPTDFSPHADAALVWARSLAAKTGARIVLMHSTYLELGGQQSLVLSNVSVHEAVYEDALRQLEELKSGASSTEIDTQVARAPADVAVIEAAEKCEADMIVMGTRGRTGLAHVVLGSVAERVIRRSAIPVVTLKAHD